MFTKNNVSKSMIDAVESVLAEDKKLLLEPDADKKDRKKNDEVKEELKGNQVKLDKNHNGKLDKHDFKLLRMKKEGVLDAIKSGAKKVMDKVAPGDDKLLKDLEKETGGKRPNMYNKPKNEEVETVEEGSVPKEKQKSPYVDRNSPESKAKVQAARDKMAKDRAAEPGKKLLAKFRKEDIGAMQSIVGENKGKKAIRVDTLKGPTISNDPEVKNANAHFSGKKATLKAEGKGTDTAVPFVTDSVSPTQREINKAVKPTFKKIKEMLGKTGTGESELPANAQISG